MQKIKTQLDQLFAILLTVWVLAGGGVVWQFGLLPALVTVLVLGIAMIIFYYFFQKWLELQWFTERVESVWIVSYVKGKPLKFKKKYAQHIIQVPHGEVERKCEEIRVRFERSQNHFYLGEFAGKKIEPQFHMKITALIYRDGDHDRRFETKKEFKQYVKDDIKKTLIPFHTNFKKKQPTLYHEIFNHQSGIHWTPEQKE